jgi:hypothetical protein
MITAGIALHPAAQFCTGLSIGGFTDWYLPARFELEIAYANLKPTTTNNSTSWGINDYSVPPRAVNYTTGSPAQTLVTAFQNTGAEPFVNDQHWSSSEFNASQAWTVSYSNGAAASGNTKSTALRVRAFRRVPV